MCFFPGTNQNFPPILLNFPPFLYVFLYFRDTNSLQISRFPWNQVPEFPVFSRHGGMSMRGHISRQSEALPPLPPLEKNCKNQPQKSKKIKNENLPVPQLCTAQLPASLWLRKKEKKKILLKFWESIQVHIWNQSETLANLLDFTSIIISYFFFFF